MEADDWYKRLLKERAELNDKICKLVSYLYGQHNKDALLQKQLRHMLDYSDVLAERLNNR